MAGETVFKTAARCFGTSDLSEDQGPNALFPPFRGAKADVRIGRLVHSFRPGLHLTLPQLLARSRKLTATKRDSW